MMMLVVVETSMAVIKIDLSIVGPSNEFPHTLKLWRSTALNWFWWCCVLVEGPFWESSRFVSGLSTLYRGVQLAKSLHFWYCPVPRSKSTLFQGSLFYVISGETSREKTPFFSWFYKKLGPFYKFFWHSLQTQKPKALDTPFVFMGGQDGGFGGHPMEVGGKWESRPPRLALFKWKFGTFLEERESLLSTFIVVCRIYVQFLIRPVRRKYSEDMCFDKVQK